MGGSRCAFRGCAVSTSRNPGIHFFRFPKRAKHIDLWIKYSGLENFLELPESQQRNKVICGRHFQDFCYMNYKFDRLISNSAVPTITRLNHQYALDYEENLNNPKLIKMEPSKAKHLIAPADFPDPLRFNTEDAKYFEKVLNKFKNQDASNDSEQEENIAKRLKVLESTTLPVSNVEYVVETDMEELSDDVKEAIIEIFEPEQSDINDLENDKYLQQELNRYKAIEQEKNAQIVELESNLANKINELNTIKTKLIEADAHIVALSLQDKEKNNLIDKLKNDLKIQWHKHKALEQEHNERNIEINEIKRKLNVADDKVRTLVAENKEHIERNEKSLHQFNAQLNDTKIKYNNLIQELETLKTERKTLKELLLRLENKNVPESQPQQVHSQQLTKLQLFNGIKRYLSPTLTALLRMQLTSSSVDRVWKADEKRIASELLNLGEQTYRYFTDEWLIRLPSLREIQSWERVETDNDDDL